MLQCRDCVVATVYIAPLQVYVASTFHHALLRPRASVQQTSCWHLWPHWDNLHLQTSARHWAHPHEWTSVKCTHIVGELDLIWGYCDDFCIGISRDDAIITKQVVRIVFRDLQRRDFIWGALGEAMGGKCLAFEERYSMGELAALSWFNGQLWILAHNLL